MRAGRPETASQRRAGHLPAAGCGFAVVVEIKRRGRSTFRLSAG
ncbi:hypothetical protein CLOSTASPAR_01437 [[Clostridium] asparagiforme DSM 15981]|uniref:Uncharacterized protein n=1 Tax=[Clostridium] asparagiforme DSM 15981 TaxID=518636 RepID=C0CWR6_9FIRM|nr:hypothetical protein CLOSTASPAR_01437 [[Clostridium] asparagiforme DSM 15981]